MDPIKEAIEKIVSKYNPQNSAANAIDLSELDNSHKQLETELVLRRNQVEEMRNELHAANLKIYELTRTLERSSSEKRELDFNLKIVQRKLYMLEDNMRDKNETLLKHKMKQELGVSESESLRKYAQEMAVQNYDYARKIGELEEQHKSDVSFQQDLVSRDVRIKTAMTDLNEAVEKLQIEHSKVIDLSIDIDCAKKASEQNMFLVQEVAKLKRENKEIVDKNAITFAKCQQLEQLLNRQDTDIESDSTAKLIILHYQTSTTDYRQQLVTAKETIEKLNKELIKEKTINAEFIIENDESIKNKGDPKIVIKNEIVEIEDE